MKILLVLLLGIFCLPASAYDQIDLELSTGTDMNITRFPGDGKTLLIWLPTERGFGKGYVSVALNLASMDYEVWAANLHDTYIIPASRDSLKEVDSDDLLALLGHAKDQGFDEIYLISGSRGVQLALELSYRWQSLNPQSRLIRGLLMFSPHLIKGRTEIGQAAEYLEISAYSHLPVFMLQPQHSTKFARSTEIKNQLEKGGSSVYMQVIRGAQGGFFMRPNEDLTEVDLLAREHLADTLDQAVQMLRFTTAAKLLSGLDLNGPVESGSKGIKPAKLHPYRGDKRPPELNLKDLASNAFNLENTRGKVVLVNFWATWCGPCVEEVPSLSRLVDKMKGKPFEVVAVNIGEDPETIREFVRSIPVNFQILLDQQGNAVRDWQVYAYPSNYLLDKQGMIRFAYRGALEWDAPEIVSTIETLL